MPKLDNAWLKAGESVRLIQGLKAAAPSAWRRVA